jgi:sigma-B regulation protein RsbU (phosphoserine phosphatase)
MSALFLSVLLKMTGQLEARKGYSPDKILELMARELVPAIHASDQARIFYAVIDRRSFDMTYSGVGRAIVLLFNSTTGKLQRLEWDVPAFQKGFSSVLSKANVALNPRDRLILCTEGVIRAQNLQGEYFGEERLYKAVLAAPRLGVHDLRNEILYQVERFAQGRDLPQDMTVVVTEVKDRIIKLAKTDET